MRDYCSGMMKLQIGKTIKLASKVGEYGKVKDLVDIEMRREQRGNRDVLDISMARRRKSSSRSSEWYFVVDSSAGWAQLESSSTS